MSRRRFAAATPLADINESEWDAQLFRGPKSLAATLGFRLRYHTLRSKGSTSGFPDRVIVRERVLFAELKTEKGKPTDAQVEWLTMLAAAGAEVYLWRPSDLDEIGRILSARGRPLSPPASAWLPSGHRNDQHVQTTLQEGATAA